MLDLGKKNEFALMTSLEKSLENPCFLFKKVNQICLVYPMQGFCASYGLVNLTAQAVSICLIKTDI